MAMMWGWGPSHMGFGAGWIGMGFMMLFWIAVIIGIIYLIRHLVRRPAAGQPYDGWAYPRADQRQEPPQPSQPSSAMRILEERYARGELDQEEFLRRKADLTS
jgi:putative membrane protein